MKFETIQFKFFLFLALLLHLIPSRKKRNYDLIIVRVDALGDYVLFMNCLNVYKDIYKGKKVLLICADLVKPLAEDDSFFTDIIDFNRNRYYKNGTYFFEILNKLRGICAKEVIYPIYERHSTGDIMVTTIVSEKKIGFRNPNLKGVGRCFNHFYSTLIEKPGGFGEIETIECFIKGTILPNFCYQLKKFQIEDVAGILEIMPQKYAVIAISASSDDKVWPADRFASLINKIPVAYNIVLCGAGTKDMTRAEEILALVTDVTRCYNMINKTTVKEMVTMINHACFVIGNDSAAVHIAAATHVPSICVFHGAHFGRFLPYPEYIGYKKYHPRIVYNKMDCYGCNFRCQWPNVVPFPCLQAVTVEMVEKEMLTLIKEVEEDEKSN